MTAASGARPVTTMADLGDGVRVRHIAWNMTGTVRVVGPVTAIRWDGSWADFEVSDEGVVPPGDLEIIAGGAS